MSQKLTVMAVRFLYERGAFYDALLPMQEAINIINDFGSGNHKPIYRGGPYDYVDGGGRWAVKTQGLIAVFQTAVTNQQLAGGGVGLGADASQSPSLKPWIGRS